MVARAGTTGVHGARAPADGPIPGDRSRHGADAPSDRLGHDERQRGRLCGHVAVAAGAVTAASAASLTVYFVLDGPFGTINDYGNGLAGALTALLAWTLRPRVATASGAAILGAALTITGSALVISEATGYFFAGLVSSVGFGLIGLWLIALNRALLRNDAQVPRRLTTFGLVAGAVMTLGLASAPGIVLALDDSNTAPAWIWIGSLNWLGTYALFPIWSIRLGRAQAL
jgi:hypothetical protein